MIGSLLKRSSTAFVVADSMSAFRNSLPFRFDGKSVGLIIGVTLVVLSCSRIFLLGADHRVRSSHCGPAISASAIGGLLNERLGRSHAFASLLRSSPSETRR